MFDPKVIIVPSDRVARRTLGRKCCGGSCIGGNCKVSPKNIAAIFKPH